MPDPISLLSIAAPIVGGLLSSNSAQDAANTAAGAQTAAAQASIAEQRRQFDAMQKLLEPYTQGGTQAMTAQGNLLGLGGQPAQQLAMQGIEGGQYAELAKQGENAILQNASATGGLRGGNVQGALAQFRPALLNKLIQQQFSNLGGLSQLGQSSAAGVGAGGLNSANSISQLLTNQGAAQAGNALAQGNINSNLWTNTFPAAITSIGGLLG